ncbi:MAG: FAD-binding protein, partial [Gammaproteobacteria bacterium]
MKRRTFVQSALATAVAASVPVGQLLAASGRSTTKIAGDINAITGSGEAKVIEKAVVEELAASLRGRLLLPSSEGYDQARKVWNGMIDKRPALIVQCQGPADVTHAVNLARDYDLLTAVRGGGHNVAGKGVCEGGIMIDLSPMQGVRVDPKAR